MAANIPDCEPLVFQAGDTMLFNRNLYDYPGSAGWVLTYTLVSGTLPVQTFATNSTTSTFQVNVAPAITAAWQPGVYLMTGTVSNGADRFTVYQGEITVNPNLEALAPGATYDYRTWAAKSLAIIELVLSGALARDDATYMINGRSKTAKSNKELRDDRDYLKSCVAQESKFGKNRKILTRFLSPNQKRIDI